MNEMNLRLPGEKDFFTKEAYKTLRTNLRFCGQDNRVICFTSYNENDGKSTVTLHVAKSFSELGKKVLVIDADMRKSVMAVRNTTVENPKGLSEVLSGISPLGDCLYQEENSTLSILFSGQFPPNPVELLGSKYFQALMDQVREMFDYVFVDTPPIGAVVDAAVVAEKCDGVVLVLGSGRVRYKQAQAATELITKSGSRFLGVVRNFRKAAKTKTYYKKAYN